MEKNFCSRVVGATNISLYAATICGMLLIVATARGQQAAGLGQTPPQAAQQGQTAGLQQDSQLQSQSAQQQGLDATQQTQQTLDAEQEQYNQQQNQLDASQPSSQQGQPGQDGRNKIARCWVHRPDKPASLARKRSGVNWVCSLSRVLVRACGSTELLPAVRRTKPVWKPATF